LIVGFAVVVTFVFSTFSERGAALTKNIRATSFLNQQLRSGLMGQVDLVRQQIDTLDEAFPDKFITADNRISEIQIKYLKLDIGEAERLTVEKIKFLYSELAVEGFHVFELRRSGNTTQAKARLSIIEDLEKQIHTRFELLNGLQMDKLEGVQNQLNRSFSAAFLAIYALAGGLIVAFAVFLDLLRKRVFAPVSSIHQAANRVREGDFSARATVHRLDEIGAVGQGFNFMAESLARSYADLESKIEERTRQVQQLQGDMIQSAKMSAVGQMISGVAHELNNPLTVIIGYTELTKIRLLKNGGDPEQLRLAVELHFQADRCRKIVSNLLQFARKVTPVCEPIWINELIEDVLQLREYEFYTRNVTIVRDYDPSSPMLYADKNKLQQVLLNLINNAYDAIRETDREGTILVRTTVLDERVVFEILDTGTGVSELKRVFEPFYTTKEVGSGTGLGLSVCYGIVKEHNGQIAAENWERGARFTVSLPVGAPEAATASTETMEEAGALGRGYRALVVDDEAPIVNLQISFLASIGIEAIGVNSGAEAISVLESRDFDLIISDVRMPGAVDGLHLHKWIGENRKELSRRFVFVTGDSMGFDAGDLFNQKPILCLEKPFNFDDYKRTIRNLLEANEGNP
jgi:signal transduction histidine kinase/ActR/RegA family two-component response regulator